MAGGVDDGVATATVDSLRGACGSGCGAGVVGAGLPHVLVEGGSETFNSAIGADVGADCSVPGFGDELEI